MYRCPDGKHFLMPSNSSSFLDVCSILQMHVAIGVNFSIIMGKYSSVSLGLLSIFLDDNKRERESAMFLDTVNASMY